MLRRSMFFGLFTALVILVACGSAAPTPLPFVTPLPAALPTNTAIPLSTPAGTLSGRVALARQGDALKVFDFKTGTETVLVARPESGTIDAVAWSPDGTQILYTASSFSPDLPIPVSDLYVANADGSNARLLITRDIPTARITDPAWSADGRAVYFTYAALLYNDDGTLRDQISELRSVTLAASAMTRLQAGAFQPALSADGQWLVFVATDPKLSRNAIWVAKPDGTAARVLVPADAFQDVSAPRFSPDGRNVLFTAYGPVQQPSSFTLEPTEEGTPDVSQQGEGPQEPHLPLETPFLPTFPPPAATAPALAWWERLLGVEIAEAHGMPADLWLMPLEGGTIKQLTRLGEDGPRGDFSPDGKWIVMLGVRGVYVMDAGGASISRFIELGGHGAISWGR